MRADLLVVMNGILLRPSTDRAEIGLPPRQERLLEMLYCLYDFSGIVRFWNERSSPRGISSFRCAVAPTMMISSRGCLVFTVAEFQMLMLPRRLMSVTRS